MSYTTYENSLDTGTPIELYEFTQSTKSWRYCSSSEDIVYLSNTFTPSSITRDAVKQTTDTFKDSMTLKFPRSNEFASQYLTYAPDSVTTVTIYRGHYGDPDGQFIVYWKGRITGAKTAGQMIEIQCESVFTSVRRMGLGARFEYGCRHALYMTGCNVNKELFKVTGNIVSIADELNITVAEASLQSDGYYNAGMISFPDGSTRFITNHTGSSLTLSRPYSGLLGGMQVSIYPGCDHLKETCLNKFNNLDNFGGFPWIPSKNPYSGSSIV